MIKRHHQASLIILSSLTLLAVLWYFFSSEKKPPQIDTGHRLNPHGNQNGSQKHIDLNVKKIDGKKVIGLPPDHEDEDLKSMKVANTASLEWENYLEENLRAQGGNSVREVTIKRIESLVLVRDGIALNVESAVITLKDDKGSVTKFRVLVDAETGKILENWDQPVIDPINPRENFGIKVDPRYHQD